MPAIDIRRSLFDLVNSYDKRSGAELFECLPDDQKAAVRESAGCLKAMLQYIEENPTKPGWICFLSPFLLTAVGIPAGDSEKIIVGVNVNILCALIEFAACAGWIEGTKAVISRDNPLDK